MTRTEPGQPLSPGFWLQHATRRWRSELSATARAGPDPSRFYRAQPRHSGSSRFRRSFGPDPGALRATLRPHRRASQRRWPSHPGPSGSDLPRRLAEPTPERHNKDLVVDVQLEGGDACVSVRNPDMWSTHPLGEGGREGW